MVERYEIEGGSLEAFRQRGLTIGDAIRRKLEIPEKSGPPWARRLVELQFSTSPLHFGEVSQIIFTDGGSSYYWLAPEGIKSFVVVAESDGRRFLFRGEKELLSGPYSRINVVAYTGDLQNLIVVCQTKDYQELHLFNAQGRIPTAITKKEIELYDTSAANLRTTAVVTDGFGQQSLLFVDREGVKVGLAEREGINQVYPSEEGNLWASNSEDGGTSFDFFTLSGERGMSFQTDEKLDLDGINVRHFNPERQAFLWSYDRDGKLEDYHRDGQLLVRNVIKFGGNLDRWLAVTEQGQEGKVSCQVVYNGKTIHETPMEYQFMELQKESGIGVVALARDGREDENWQLLCFTPEGYCLPDGLQNVKRSPIVNKGGLLEILVTKNGEEYRVVLKADPPLVQEQITAAA